MLIAAVAIIPTPAHKIPGGKFHFFAGGISPDIAGPTGPAPGPPKRRTPHLPALLRGETRRMTAAPPLQTALGAFIYPYLITNGGPLHLSETLISYSLFLLWTQRSWGYGSAVAVLSFVLSIIITGFVLRFSKPRDTEDLAPRVGVGGGR